MAQTNQSSTKKIILLVLLLGLLIGLGAVLRWYLDAPKPKPPAPPPLVQQEPPPEPVKEPVPEPVPDASAREPIPEVRPKPRVPARARRPRRRRWRRRPRRRKPKKRKPKKRVEPKKKKPKKKPKKRPKPKKKKKKKKPKKRKRPKPPPPPPVPGQLILRHVGKISGPFQYLRVSYTLDGKTIMKRSKGLSLGQSFLIYKGSLPQGKHNIFADVFLRGVGFGAFASLNSMRIQLRSALPFKIRPKQRLIVEVQLHENKSVALKKRLSIKFKQTREPIKEPPPKR